jgi:hypothetical protein
MTKPKITILVTVTIFLGLTGIGRIIIDCCIAPGITERNIDYLRVGMNVKQVEAILGEPCSESSTFQGGSLMIWRSGHITFEVAFEKNGTLRWGFLYDRDFSFFKAVQNCRSSWFVEVLWQLRQTKK